MFGLDIPSMYAIAFALALVLCGGVHLLLQRTALGRDIRAASEDGQAAGALGVDVSRVHMFVFGLAAACAGIGGVLVGATFGFTPTSGTTYLLTGFVVVVLGGLGSVKGTLLGAILLGVIEAVGSTVLRRRLPRLHRLRRVPDRPVVPPAGPVRKGAGRLTQAHTRRAIAALVLIGGAIVLYNVPQFASDYELLVAYEIAQLAALALAWNVMAGYGGLVSLAVSAFVGIGSYATAKLSISSGFGLVPSILMGGVFAVLFALLVAVPMFRFRGLYFTIGSLVLAQALALFMINYNGLGGNAGLTLLDVAPTAGQLYQLAFGCAVIAIVGTVLVIRGRLGLGLMAVRDDEDVAERVGVATFRTKLVAFMLSAFVMGLIGGIQAQKLGQIEPHGSFTLTWTIDAVNAAIIGGIGTVVGPIVGAAIIVELSERLADYPETHLTIIGVLLIVIIRFAPAGVWGTILRYVWPQLRKFLPAWLVPRSAGVTLGGSGFEPETSAPSAVAAAADPARPSGPGGATLLRATGVGKAYGGNRAVDDVDMEIRSGEVLGVIGPNGAGKSTLIGLLSGAIAGEGKVELFGDDVTGLGAQTRARRGIGRTHQVPRPFGRLTVLENLMVAQMHGAGESRGAALAEVERILERCGLSDYAGVPASELGLLRLKRLELARALAVKPRILLLDEIGAGLVESEVAELIELINALRDEVDAILVVEHILDVIRGTCDRLVVVDRGKKLVEGEPSEVLADAQVAAVYLGTSGGEEVAHAPRPPRAARRRRCWRSTAWPPSTARSARCTTCRSASARARSWRCSAPTAPARRPPRARSAG